MTRPHDEIEALLPFYVNGSLEDDDRAAVEAALASEPYLRKDVAALAAIRDTMQSDHRETRSPGDFGLARLMRDIDGARRQTVQPDQAPPIGRARLWQIAAGILLAVGLVQAVLLYQAGSDGFRLASGSGETQAVLTVAFNPDARESEIRALMLAAGVEVVSGPSAVGLYDLSCTPGIAVDEAFAQLAAATDIIESVSRIDE